MLRSNRLIGFGVKPAAAVPTATNLALKSQAFNDSSVWTLVTAITIGADGATDPTGASVAETLTPTAVTGSAFFQQSNLATTAVDYTFSVYGKPNGYSWIELVFSRDASYTVYWTKSFNLTTGAIGTTRTSGISGSAAIVAAANSYYRCSVTITQAATANAACLIGVGPADAFNAAQTSNGTSGIIGTWAQVEIGSSATTYNPNL